MASRHAYDAFTTLVDWTGERAFFYYQMPGNPEVQVTQVKLEGKVSEGGCFLGRVAAEQDFGQVVAGTVKDQVVRLHNTGCQALTVTDLVSSAPEFVVVSQLPLTVAARGSQDVVVRFAPTALGEVSGVLTVRSDAGNQNENNTVLMRGVGSSQVAGDVTADGLVNVLDVLCVVNVILGSDTTHASAADVNADGMVNILDALGLANLIVK